MRTTHPKLPRLLVVTAQGGNYPDAANYYVRIMKADLTF